MAAIFRLGIRLVNNNPSSKLLSNKELKIQFRGIAGKSLRSIIQTEKKPAPWPYREKTYNWFHHLYDKTTARLDENSKIIVIEGPVAVGKTKLAKQLAEELDMLHLPEANQDMVLINDYGYDLRKLDEELPEMCRSFDIKDFLLNPRHKLAATFQIQQFIVRFSQYVDALAHVLSTGQGVVLERCVYSDFVFLEAMFSQGYLSKGARSVYYDLRRNCLFELLRPHLILYLDVPVEKVIEKIKKRNKRCETRSTVLTPEYLRAMENCYKQNYLREISTHAELLVYDWSEEAEVEVVVEDIERIDFGNYDKQDSKMKDWVYPLEEEWATIRHLFSDKKDELMTNINVPRFDVPELIVEADDARKYRDTVNEAPGMKYLYGYNPNVGDTGLLFKTGRKHRYTLPLIERRLE